MLSHRRMDQQSAAQSSSGTLVRHWPWLAVLLVLLTTAFIRFRVLDVPLERDEGEYAYAGQLLLHGTPPYELAYNMKLPGTYFAYAIGMAVFGQTTAGVHLTLLAVNSLSIVFVFLLGRLLFGLAAGLTACASYAVMSVSPAVLGMATHANQFVVLFAVPATFCIWRYAETRRMKFLAFSGILYGLAFLMKQQGIVFALFGIIFFAWQEFKIAPKNWSDVMKRTVWFVAALLLPLALTCLYLSVSGVFGRFWFWTFTYAGKYAGEESWGAGLQSLGGYVHQKWPIYAGFFLLIFSGLPLIWRRKELHGKAIFVFGFLLFSFLGTAIGLYFRPHYFILTLPALAIVAGMAVESIQSFLRPVAGKFAAALLVIAVLGWNLYFQRNYFFRMSNADLCRIVYGANPLNESWLAAEYIRQTSGDTARIAVVGSEPQIYFYSHRLSATGYIYTYPMMERQPYAAKMQREMVREIEINRPEYLVLVLYRYSWLLHDASDTTVIGWAQNYAKQFYDMTGVVNTAETGEMTAVWGDAAKTYRGPWDQFLIVYKRRP